MHVCSSIAKYSAPLPNTFVTHKVWSIHCTHSAMNFSCTMTFSLQKTDHCVNLALAGSFYSSTHVNMLKAQWELSAMAGRVMWDEAIVYRSVLWQCQVAIFTGLPTLAHRTLISKYALYWIYTYLLTVQSPSWEANWFAASQKIPRISQNLKVHYRTHKRLPPVSILGQPNPVHIPTSHLLEFHRNIIHPSMPRSPQCIY